MTKEIAYRTPDGQILKKLKHMTEAEKQAYRIAAIRKGIEHLFPDNPRDCTTDD